MNSTTTTANQELFEYAAERIDGGRAPAGILKLPYHQRNDRTQEQWADVNALRLIDLYWLHHIKHLASDPEFHNLLQSDEFDPKKARGLLEPEHTKPLTNQTVIKRLNLSIDDQMLLCSFRSDKIRKHQRLNKSAMKEDYLSLKRWYLKEKQPGQRLFKEKARGDITQEEFDTDINAKCIPLFNEYRALRLASGKPKDATDLYEKLHGKPVAKHRLSHAKKILNDWLHSQGKPLEWRPK